MLNVLWFKEHGGREKYAEYGAAVAPLLDAVGGQAGEMYKPEQALIGDWDPDAIFVVKYPSMEAFESMAGSPEYAEIMHLREEALDNSLLVRCSEFDWASGS